CPRPVSPCAVSPCAGFPPPAAGAPRRPAPLAGPDASPDAPLLGRPGHPRAPRAGAALPPRTPLQTGRPPPRGALDALGLGDALQCSRWDRLGGGAGGNLQCNCNKRHDRVDLFCATPSLFLVPSPPILNFVKVKIAIYC